MSKAIPPVKASQENFLEEDAAAITQAEGQSHSQFALKTSSIKWVFGKTLMPALRSPPPSNLAK
jgi:hypothetical protein